ncbi:hypothetical protein KGQ64_17735, partial [bacterium]|nr:hypothetical protein [bacterium]
MSRECSPDFFGRLAPLDSRRAVPGGGTRLAEPALEAAARVSPGRSRRGPVRRDASSRAHRSSLTPRA